MTSPTPHEHCDVLVVGARVAGAATALQLARRGLRVLAIDRAPTGADTLSTHALMRTGVIQLARWGVLDDVLEAGTPTIERTVFHYGDDAVPIEIAPDRHADGLCAPRRTVLDGLLVDHARDAGADVRHRCHLVALTRDRFGRVDGAVVHDGRDRTIRAGLVVGADGAGSAVAEQVSAPTRWRGTRGWSGTVYAYVDGLASDTSHWHFTPGVTSGVIPTNDGRANVFVAVGARRFREQVRPDVRTAWWRLLEIASPGVARHARTAHVSRVRSFPGRQPFVRRAHGPGWALVGDAGLYDDPATAHGISSALRDAELFADALEAGDVARFQRARDAIAEPISAVTDRIASLEWDLDQLRGLHRELSRAMRAEADVMSEWRLGVATTVERSGAA